MPCTANPGSDNVNKVRYDIFRSRYDATTPKLSLSNTGGIDLSLLPPCRSSLEMHCLRVNYQCYVWNHAHIGFSDVQSPIGLGWKLNEDGHIAVDWTKGDIIPPQLIDIMAEATPNDSTENDDSGDDEEMFSGQDVEECEIDNIIDVILEDDDDE